MKLLTLISDKATAFGFILPMSGVAAPLTNLWGSTNIRTSASFAASNGSGTAI